jgi:Holliday junction resolvase RusA-like endonuclease
MTDALRLWVRAPVLVTGSQLSQGSKTPWGTEVHADTLVPWRNSIRAEALRVWHPRKPLEGPLRMDVLFMVPRYRSTKEGTLPCTLGTGDNDKLMRAIGDALGPMGKGRNRQPGIVYRDDAQLVDTRLRKDWAGWCELHTVEVPAGALVFVAPCTWLDRGAAVPREYVGAFLATTGRSGLVSSRP